MGDIQAAKLGRMGWDSAGTEVALSQGWVLGQTIATERWPGSASAWSGGAAAMCLGPWEMLEPGRGVKGLVAAATLSLLSTPPPGPGHMGAARTPWGWGQAGVGGCPHGPTRPT